METKNCYIAGFLFLFLILSCEDDESEISAPIAGVWAGKQVDFKIDPEGVIPAFTLSEDTFPVTVEFKNEGTVILTDDDQTTTGTYEMNGRNLTINIDYDLEYIGLAGNYTIEELTNTHLIVSIEKEGSYEHPETSQQFDGTVEATLFFDRRTD